MWVGEGLNIAGGGHNPGPNTCQKTWDVIMGLWNVFLTTTPHQGINRVIEFIFPSTPCSSFNKKLQAY
jgi:hypothetical protein